MMPRPILATIHTQALAHNLQRAREQAQGAKVWAVVKANAYGHGIERAFEGLKAADGFALLDLAEAERLRKLGWAGPILLLEGCFGPEDLAECERLDLWHTVHGNDQIAWLERHKASRPHRVFLKMNSGMNRLGFTPVRFAAAWQRLNAVPHVKAHPQGIALATHFANSDGPGGYEAIRVQMEAFNQGTIGLPGERSLANSAATLAHAGNHAVKAHWVRPGIMLYGSSPHGVKPGAAEWSLKPTMSLNTRVIAVQEVQPGQSIGYGSTYTVAKDAPPLRIGVVACGYADGYPRHAPGHNAALGGLGTPVLVDGVRTRTVGRVSMDMITVDLTPVPQAKVGSEATLWGLSSGGQWLSIDEVAEAAGTVGYELMCALAPRVPVRVD